jgi:site-specific DNA recombinase
VKMINMNRITAIYIRVSTSEQAKEGFSIPTQLEKLTAFAKARGKNNIETFIDDGYTARNTRRPDFQRLMKLIKKGLVADVYTLYLDRMFRNLRDLLNFIALLDEYKSAYVCATLDFDTSSPLGRAFIQILGAVAELESNMKSVVVKEVMSGILKNQRRYLAVPPFGYQFDENKVLAIVPEEAYWIRKAADHFIAGHGYRSVAKLLNKNGVLTRKSKSWGASTVRQMLTNELYIGTIVWNRRHYNHDNKMLWRDEEEWITETKAHPAIYTSEQWEAITARITRRVPRGGQAQSKHRLSGLCKCAYCGYSMVARHYNNREKYKKRSIFVCSNYQKSGSCRFNYIFIDELDREVYQVLEQYSNGHIDITPKDITHAMESKESDFQRREDSINQRFQRQIQAYEMGLISEVDLRLARDRIEKEREILRQERAQQPKNNDLTGLIKDEAKKLIWLWNNGELPELQHFLRNIIGQITILDGKAYLDLSPDLFH